MIRVFYKGKRFGDYPNLEKATENVAFWAGKSSSKFFFDMPAETMQAKDFSIEEIEIKHTYEFKECIDEAYDEIVSLDDSLSRKENCSPEEISSFIKREERGDYKSSIVHHDARTRLILVVDDNIIDRDVRIRRADGASYTIAEIKAMGAENVYERYYCDWD